ncbi:MAG: hypothetical protein KGK01_10000 [Bradyrhizobium sp.]|uniref:hypothetical protein n=1 Tax=Bradyrhizobium sp. TaxID=376 RepID=UPI001C29C842|nr:hypothetical protein [Bradyrhizobium sp.]MBU6462316.1 hypothetical protein [Pseudomonadota bacterium]MDE2067368.1 hypothetical protein [Bradyrhizobium sp.]MDE2242750.1 hypothetical protein [Bradyrhizobium sp.]MDE2468630.1 hypothetical protein [Bradyrhizobium sp.]
MLPLARFESLVHRFHDWKDRLGNFAPEVNAFVGPSFDFDVITIEAFRRMRARCGWKLEILNLGGLKMRVGPELEQWLVGLRSAGIIGFHVSLAGVDGVHDRWNSRTGDFAFQTEILRRGGAMGMVRHERLFLAKNTLPVFDQLLNVLEAIPGDIRDRYAVPFFYQGRAVKYESERIDENDRDHLLARVKNLRLWLSENWLSEREWLPRLKERAGAPKEVALTVEVNEKNIDRLEAQTCEEVFADAQSVFLMDWAGVPDIEELCDHFGDSDGRKIYSTGEELETKLFDIYRVKRSGGRCRNAAH